MAQKQFCYGVVPLQNVSGDWMVLLVKRTKGFWEFPKGHAEDKEEPRTAAVRELREETGLRVSRLIYDIPLKMEYIFHSDRGETHKTVYYYLAEVEGRVSLQPEEIAESRWLPLPQAQEELTYSASKELCRRVNSMLSL